MLLPVLRALQQSGRRVELVTHAAWAPALRALSTGLHVHTERREGTLDLDQATSSVRPSEHRTDEFADLLGVPRRHWPILVRVPAAWAEPFHRSRGPVVFAPEAAHPSRRWPIAYARQVAALLQGRPLWLTGLSQEPMIPCDEDLRGRLSLQELFGSIAAASAVIGMDSAVVQIAMMLGVPVVAIFGGVDPRFRILPDARAVALVGRATCRPCNKNETCGGAYDCIRRIQASDVMEALERLPAVRHREIWER
ncbi:MULTISPECIES: glycosyltransferase family 9 protein [Sorangium]|nr:MULTISPECIES: glycosyltransferase family 9 protein [Sorangium]